MQDLIDEMVAAWDGQAKYKIPVKAVVLSREDYAELEHWERLAEGGMGVDLRGDDEDLFREAIVPVGEGTDGRYMLLRGIPVKAVDLQLQSRVGFVLEFDEALNIARSTKLVELGNMDLWRRLGRAEAERAEVQAGWWQRLRAWWKQPKRFER